MSTPEPDRRTRWIGRALMGVSLAVLLLGGGALILIRVLGDAPPPAAPRVPVPNGYDDLVRAGESILGDVPARGQVAAADEGALGTWVRTNVVARQLLAQGLDREIAAPLQYTSGYLTSHASDLGPLRKAAYLLAAEGYLELKHDRPEAAADRFLDLLKMARGVSRNGLLIDVLVGVAFERMALQGLSKARDRLPAADCRRVARTLEEFDRDREPFDPIRRRDRDLALESGGWRLRVAYRVNPATFDRLAKPAEDNNRFAIRVAQARARLMAVEMALRAYRLEHKGRVARSLDDLVPAQLTPVPVDPFSPNGSSLRLKARPGSPPLPYSVGPDGVDDHATPIPDARLVPGATGDVLADPS